MVMVLICSGLVGFADDAWAEELPPAELGIGIRHGEGVTEGVGDVLAPVLRLDSGLLFVNPRAIYGDNSEEEVNLGLGYRHLCGERNLILGANIYYDHRQTQANNSFDQVGLGLEWLSSWFDGRANYYFGDNDRKLAHEFETAEVSQSTRASTKWEDPFAVEHRIEQSGETTFRTTTSTTRSYFEQFEKAMEGYDLELGAKLPIPHLDSYGEVRIFGGYYHFDGDFGEDIEGFKGRLEIRAMSGLYIDAELREDQRLDGSDYYVGLQWRIPFDLAKLTQGRNPFEGALTRPVSQSFASRLTDRVIRDPQIQVEISDFIENEEKRNVHREITQRSQKETVVLADNVTFVDGDNQSGQEDGTAENPYDTVQEGVDNTLAGRMVYVNEAVSVYDEQITIPAPLTLRGSGSPIEGMGGKQFGSGIHPLIHTAQGGPIVRLEANGVLLTGLDIKHTAVSSGVEFDPVTGLDLSMVGIYGENITGTVIQNNRFENNTYGVMLVADALPDFNARLMNNQILNGVLVNGEGGGALIHTSGSGGGDYDVWISGTFSDNEGTGVDVAADGFEEVNLTLRNVDAQRNKRGLDLSVHAEGGTRLSLNNVMVTDNQDEGIFFRQVAAEQGDAITYLDGVTADNNFVGVYFEGHAAYSEFGRAEFVMVNSAANGNTTAGLEFRKSIAKASNGPASALFVNDTLNRNADGLVAWGEGVYAGDGPAVLQMRYITAKSNLFEGVAFLHGGAYAQTGNALLEITRSEFSHNFFPDVFFITGNGLLIKDSAVAEQGIATVNLEDIVAIDNRLSGIKIRDLNCFSHGDFNLNLNRIEAKHNGTGIDLFGTCSSQTGISRTVIRDVSVNNNSEGLAITQHIDDNAENSIHIENVVSTGNSSDGLFALITSSVMATNASYGVLVENSTFSNNGNDGIELRTAGSSNTLFDLNFGNATTGEGGFNSIYNNSQNAFGGYDLFSWSSIPLHAENNWWGTTTPLPSQFRELPGPINYTPHLLFDPNI